MAITATVTPAYPTTRAPAKASFTLPAGANFVRLWLVDAPLGSTHRKALDEAPSSRVQAWQGSANETFQLQADVGGVYVYKAQAYAKGSDFGGGYAGDTRGAPTETAVGSEETISIHVGTRLTMPVGAGSDTAMLVLWVWDDTVRPTSFGLQGETSPALIDPSSDKARAAMQDSQVKTALANLADKTATTVTGSPMAVVADMVTKIRAHFASTSVHAAADSDNTIPAGTGSGSSPQALIADCAAIMKALDQHERNDDGVGGTGTAGYHVVSGTNRPDMTNRATDVAPANMASAIAAVANLWRAYEGHRANANSHTTVDATNALSSLPPLLELHRRFLDSVLALSPTAPANTNPGAVTLVARAGMTEA